MTTMDNRLPAELPRSLRRLPVVVLSLTNGSNVPRKRSRAMLACAMTAATPDKEDEPKPLTERSKRFRCASPVFDEIPGQVAATKNLIRTIDDLIRELQSKRDFIVTMRSSSIKPRISAAGNVKSLVHKSRRLNLFEPEKAHTFLLTKYTSFSASVVDIVNSYLHKPTPRDGFGIRLRDLMTGDRLDIRTTCGKWVQGIVLATRDGPPLGLQVRYPLNVETSSSTIEWIDSNHLFRFAPLRTFTPEDKSSKLEKNTQGKPSAFTTFNVNDDVQVWRFAPPRRKWVPAVVTNVNGNHVEATYFYKKIKPFSRWFHVGSGEVMLTE